MLPSSNPAPAWRFTMHAGLCQKDCHGLVWSFGFREAFDFLKSAFSREGIKGFNIQQCTGVWDGVEEESIVVTLVSFSPYDDRLKFERVALAYKMHFKQEAVLVTAEVTRAKLI